MSLEHSPARSGLRRMMMSIDEFCETHRISRSKFYQLWRSGDAPVVTDVGGVQLISDENAAAWRKNLSKTSAVAKPGPVPIGVQKRRAS